VVDEADLEGAPMTADTPPADGRDDESAETDDRFPSGPWTGFYMHHGWSEKFRQELSLSFREGVMTGEGLDGIGTFLIRGRYDCEDARCHWVKRYLGAHDVIYEGYAEGRGIWGTWKIPPLNKGGFHIWPEGMAEGQGERTSAEEDQPAGISFEPEEIDVSFRRV
jgi:hypothetical protein